MNRPTISIEETARELGVPEAEYRQIEGGETPAERWGPILAAIAIELETPSTRLLAESGKSKDTERGQAGTLIAKHRERRNKTIEECDRYESASLEQINGKLTQIQSRQEAALDLLASEERATDYEDVARMQIASEEFEASRALAAPKTLAPNDSRP